MKIKIILFISLLLNFTMFAQETFFQGPVDLWITEIDFGASRFYPENYEYHYDIDFFRDFFENYAIEKTYEEIHYAYNTYPILISGVLTYKDESYSWTYNEGGWGTLTDVKGQSIILVDPRYKLAVSDNSLNYIVSMRRGSLNDDIRETDTFAKLLAVKDIFVETVESILFPDPVRKENFNEAELLYFIFGDGTIVLSEDITIPESWDPRDRDFYTKASKAGYITEPYEIPNDQGFFTYMVTISFLCETTVGQVVFAADIYLNNFVY